MCPYTFFFELSIYCCHCTQPDMQFSQKRSPVLGLLYPKRGRLAGPYIRCYVCFMLFLPNVSYINYPDLLARLKEAVHFSCSINQRWLVWGHISLPFAILKLPLWCTGISDHNSLLFSGTNHNVINFIMIFMEKITIYISQNKQMKLNWPIPLRYTSTSKWKKKLW